MAEAIGDEENITELIVTGKMNKYDFLTITANETLRISLQSIDISNVDLKDLPGETFYLCENLRKVILPNTLENIGEDAFLDCTSLTEINIPSGVNHIGEYAFSGYSALTAIILPDIITEINEGENTINKEKLNGGALLQFATKQINQVSRPNTVL